MLAKQGHFSLQIPHDFKKFLMMCLGAVCKQRHGNEHNCQQGTHSQMLPAKLAWLAAEAQWYRHIASNARAATSEAMAAITGNTVAIDFLKNTVSLIGGASQHSFPDLAVAVCILVVIGHNGKRFVTEFIDFCTVHLEQKWLYFHERNQ